MLPDKITVQVDCTTGVLSREIFMRPQSCYVAKALKEAGYDVESAGSYKNGPRLINPETGRIVFYKYEPPFEMLYEVFVKVFENKEVLTINMTKI